jgi:hypothetical protein
MEASGLAGLLEGVLGPVLNTLPAANRGRWRVVGRQPLLRADRPGRRAPGPALEGGAGGKNAASTPRWCSTFPSAPTAASMVLAEASARREKPPVQGPLRPRYDRVPVP